MDEQEQAKAALAWMRKQAQSIDSSINADEPVFWCARIISAKLLTSSSTWTEKVTAFFLRLKTRVRFFCRGKKAIKPNPVPAKMTPNELSDGGRLRTDWPR